MTSSPTAGEAEGDEPLRVSEAAPEAGGGARLDRGTRSMGISWQNY